MREIRLSGSMWRGPETERWRTLHGHEARKRRTQPRAACTPPRRPPTRLVSFDVAIVEEEQEPSPLSMQIAEGLSERSLGRRDGALRRRSRRFGARRGRATLLTPSRTPILGRVASERRLTLDCEQPRDDAHSFERDRSPSRAASTSVGAHDSNIPGGLPPARSRNVVTLVPSHWTVRARSFAEKRRTLSESPLGE